MKYIFTSFFLLASLPAFASGLDIPLFATSAMPGVAAVPTPTPEQQEEQPQDRTTPNIGIQAENLSSLTVAPGIVIPISNKPNYALPFHNQNSNPQSIIRIQELPTMQPMLTDEVPAQPKKRAITPATPKLETPVPPNEVLDTNIYNFDIDEFALGETPQSVQEIAQMAKLSVDRIDYAIQPFLENMLTMRCKQQGFYTQADVKQCMRQEADRIDAYYISTIVLKRPQTKETYTINFTSFLTGNQAYRVQYVEQGDHSLGSSVKDTAAKAARKKAFWDKIYETYGVPSNTADKVWGVPERLYMKASIPETRLDATLLLEDKALEQQDLAAAKTFFLNYIEDMEDENV